MAKGKPNSDSGSKPAASNSAHVAALEWILSPAAMKARPPIVAVFGGDGFLVREVLDALRARLCGEGDGDFLWRTFEGGACELRDVLDDIGAGSLFGSGDRVSAVLDADPFVKAYRDQLEDLCARPPAGVLVLVTSAWPSNTRLAKGVDQHGLAIDCRIPDKGAPLQQFLRSARRWLEHRAATKHNIRAQGGALDALIDLLPTSLGLFDQELGRLALLLACEPGAPSELTEPFVREHVGGWRAQTAWDMIDAAAEGDAALALGLLDRLLLAGDVPIGLLAQASSSLRRLAAAAHAVAHGEASGRRVDLRQALARAGTPPYWIEKAERQLRQVGRDRALALSQALLEADLAMKGHNSTPERSRYELERLLVRLCRQAAPARSSAGAR